MCKTILASKIGRGTRKFEDIKNTGYSTGDRIVISGVNLNKVNIMTRMRK